MTRARTVPPGWGSERPALPLQSPPLGATCFVWSPSPVNNGIKSKLLPTGVTDFKKKPTQEHLKKMKNLSHQHFLFKPEFMNFNQINTGVFGINICTIMQNYFYGCDEN